ncbi:Bbp19 family protein [Cloacibacillus evryensis]|uniref:Bbp19-like phage domain-containing protein n=1 Tax=Cloacibacillus evryensis TaxID=508460 RepID=A0AAW5K0Y7_9BACT|nr:hypothetical protein [Cloacibacillus evryensis]MCQ4813561.1 hypothetical protein [Cloacibacillus evryensis]
MKNNEEYRKEIAEKNRQRREEEINDLRAVLSSVSGRRFIWRLLERGGVFRSSFNAESDSYTAFNEGRRNLGLLVLNDILEADLDAFTLMQEEAKVQADLAKQEKS